MCGSSIPEDQSVCSMCYGDISYGSDGYYEEWARLQESHYEEGMRQHQEELKETEETEETEKSKHNANNNEISDLVQDLPEF